MSFLNRRWFILLVSLAVVFIVLLPYLAGGKVLRGDSGDGVIPYFSFLKKAFQSGESPFWNPLNAGGFPVFITYGHPFFPLHFLLFLFSPLLTHHLGLWLMLSLALFFTILFIRRLQPQNNSLVGLAAAFIAGLGYLISQIVYENNASTAYAVLFLPLFFWGLAAFITSSSRRARLGIGALLAASVAAGWLAGGSNFQFLTYAVLAGFAFGLYWAKKNNFGSLRFLISFGLIVGLGTLVGLFQILPAFAISQFSLRQGGLSFDYVASTAPVRWSDIILFLNPFFQSRSAEAFLYMGLVPLVLFIASFFFRKVPCANFFRWLFVAALAVAIYRSPLLWLIQQIPILNYFRHPSRFMFLGSFAAAVLVGLTGERFLRLIGRKLTISKKSVAASVLVLLIVFTIFDYSYVFRKKFLAESVKAATLTQSELTEPLKELDGRVFAIIPDDTASVFFWRLTGTAPPNNITANSHLAVSTLFPNLNLYYGVESLELYDPLLAAPLGRLLSLVGARQLGDYGEQKLHKLNTSELEKLRLLKEREGLLDFLGARYLLAGFDLGELNFNVKRVGVVPVLPLQAGEYTLAFHIYENLTAAPIVYSTPVTQFTSDDEAAHQAFRENNFKGIFVTCPDCAVEPPQARGEVIIQERTGTKLTLKANSLAEHFIVFSQNNLPGWRAFIDNQPAKLLRVNSVFMGLLVGPGEREVTFEFRYPWLLRAGFSQPANGSTR